MGGISGAEVTQLNPVNAMLAHEGLQFFQVLSPINIGVA